MSFVTGLTYILATLLTAAFGALAILAGVRLLGDVAWAWFLDHTAVSGKVARVVERYLRFDGVAGQGETAIADELVDLLGQGNDVE